MTNLLTAGTQVTFRPDFSDALKGIVFEVDGAEVHTDASNGRKFVSIRTRVNGKRWGYRTAYVTDLIPAL